MDLIMKGDSTSVEIFCFLALQYLVSDYPKPKLICIKQIAQQHYYILAWFPTVFTILYNLEI